MEDQTFPFACDMTALEPPTRQQHIATTQALFEAVEFVDELPNGYAFRLPNESEVLMRVARFVANERRCCPFFGFGLELEPENGPLWLRLTGREGVKPFIIAEIGGALREEVALKAGWHQPGRTV